MTATVTVYHNNNPRDARVFGYKQDHTVTEVFRYETRDSDRTATAYAEQAFELFNIGDDPTFGTPDQRAVDYRARKNRSLSVGDVVRVQGLAWLPDEVSDVFLACGSYGWTLINAPTVDNQTSHGTTPIESTVDGGSE